MDEAPPVSSSAQPSPKLGRGRRPAIRLGHVARIECCCQSPQRFPFTEPLLTDGFRDGETPRTIDAMVKVRPDRLEGLPAALEELGLEPPLKTLVVVGGAERMSADEMTRRVR